MPPRRPGRLASFGYLGKYSYFLTLCAYERRASFSSVERIECVHSEILRTCSDHQFAIPAGVFMPDHLHLLVRGLKDESDLKVCLKLARQRSAVAFHRAFSERLWQDGWRDHVVRDADDARRVTRYIVDNPVKAGLCRVPQEYQYSWWPDRSMNLAHVRSAEL